MKQISTETAMDYLLRHFSKEEWLSVIKPCIEAVCLNDGRPSVVNLLKLLESIPYNGFRNLFRAVKSNRRTEAEKYIVELMQSKRGPLIPIILFAWDDLCDESFRKLKDAAVEGLRCQTTVEIKNTVEVSGTASDDLIHEYLVEIAGYAKVPHSDIGLAVELCCVLASREYVRKSNTASVEGSPEVEEAIPFASQEYVALLAAVKSAEEESPLLTEAEPFLIELQSVLETKKQEFKTKGQRVEQIKLMIENLQNQYSRILDYFDTKIAYNTSVSREAISLQGYEELEKKLDAAQQHLDEKAVRAITRKTEQAWGMEMDRLWTAVASDPYFSILLSESENAKDEISKDPLVPNPQPEVKAEQEQEPNPNPQPEVKAEQEQEPRPNPQPEMQAETEMEAHTEQESELEAEQSSESKPKPKPKMESMVNEENKVAAALWRLIATDDLAGAYWLAKADAMIDRRENSIFPVLTEILLLGRAVGPETIDLSSNLAELVQKIDKLDCVAEETQGLLVAVSLRASVVAPESGAIAWLAGNNHRPELHEILEAVRDFATSVPYLRSQDLKGAVGVEDVENSIQSAADTLQALAAQGRRHKLKMLRAGEVMSHILDERNGAFGSMLPSVWKKDYNCAQHLRNEADNWLNRDYVLRRVEEADRTLHGMAVSSITGHPRDQLITRLSELARALQAWCEAVRRKATFTFSEDDYVVRQVRKLSDVLDKGGQRSLDELLIASKSASSFEKATILQQAYFLAILMEELGLSAVIEANLRWFCQQEFADLYYKDQLKRRRWLLYEAPPTLDDISDADEMRQLKNTLIQEEAGQRTWKQAFWGWVNREDFRCAADILAMLADDREYEMLTRELRERELDAKFRRDQMLEETYAEVEQALIDGVITEPERQSSIAVLEKIQESGTSAYGPQMVSMGQVKQHLRTRKDRQVERVNDEWNELQDDLKRRRTADSKIQEIKGILMISLSEGNIRAADEVLSQLREYVTGRQIFPEHLNSEQPQITSFSLFSSQQNSLNSNLMKSGLDSFQRALKSGDHEWHGISFERFSRPTRETVEKMIVRWRRIKDVKDPQDPNLAENIQGLLQFLDFQFIEGKPGTKIVQNNQEEKWVLLEAAASQQDSPVQDFGSRHSGPYYVLCLWERPMFSTIGQWVEKLGLENKCVIIIYLGRLNFSNRCVMKRKFAERRITAVTLDEVLLCFLAGQDRRGKSFFECALSFALINPYTPFQAGDVPPEMFFGRQDYAKKLRDRKQGNMIVYGGRQLGKSALLRHVQRQFHNPQRRQYAWAEDIKLLGDPSHPLGPEQLWDTIIDIFENKFKIPVFAGGKRSAKTETKIQKLAATMEANPDIEVLLMFDEADNFLSADGNLFEGADTTGNRRQTFEVVEKLRTWTRNCNYRVRVVFAGLHNVQRFEGIANQPFAHFGGRIEVGPLEGIDAFKLVEVPFSLLGFVFENRALILHILSYTNYHPGLIQLFCRELMEKMQKETASKEPPYIIERRHVEAVYQDSDLRKRFRERFDMTLALDPRYQVIAWSMILDQAMDERASFDRMYGNRDLQKLAEDNGCNWLTATGNDEFRGVLDEMCGLGMLLRMPDGRYRLRNINVVRMVGMDASEIEARLLEVICKTRQPQRDGSVLHAPFTKVHSKNVYSPFTRAQNRLIRAETSGVVLVGGCRAAGMDRIQSVLEKNVLDWQTEGIKSEMLTIPPHVKTAASVHVWLEEKCHKPGWDRALIWGRLNMSREEMPGFIHEITEACRKNNNRRTMRFILGLYTDDLGAWLSLNENERLNNGKAEFIGLHRWSKEALDDRLRLEECIVGDDGLSEVWDATGGWHELIESVFEKMQQCEIKPVAQRLKIEINDQASRFAHEATEWWGIRSGSPELNIIRQLAENKAGSQGVDRDMLIGLVALECSSAGSMAEELSRQALERLEILDIIKASGDEVRLDPCSGQILAAI